MQVSNPSHIIPLTIYGLAMACLALSGALLLPGLTAMLLLLVLLRICWIEDNLHSDLIHTKTLPIHYKNTQIRRAKFFQSFHITTPIETCPQRMASQLRQQSWLLQAGLYAGLAGLITTHPFYWPIGLALLWLAMTKCETHLMTSLYLNKKQALPYHMVCGRPKWLFLVASMLPQQKPDHWRD